MATMSLKFLAFFALSAFVATVVADVPQVDFEKLMNDAKTNFEQVLNDIKKHVKMPEHGDDVLKAVKDESDKVALQLEGLKKKLDEEVAKHPEVTDTIKKLQDKMNEAIENLKTQNPDITANAEKLNNNLKSAWDSVTAEVKNSYDTFQKNGGVQDIQNLFNNFYETAKTQAATLQEKIQEITKQKS